MTPPPDISADVRSTTDGPDGAADGRTRADRFVRELAELKIPDPAGGRSTLWLRLGTVLLLAALVLGALTFPLAHASDNPLAQRDALAIGLAGVVSAVVGGALFLRYSLTGFLRFWLARQSYDLSVLGDRLTADPPRTAASTEGDHSNGATRTDPAPR